MNLTKSGKAQCQDTKCTRIAKVHLMQKNRPGVYPRESPLVLCTQHATEALENPNCQVREIGRSQAGYYPKLQYIALTPIAREPAGFELVPAGGTAA
jgi:hypothetical protein